MHRAKATITETQETKAQVGWRGPGALWRRDLIRRHLFHECKQLLEIKTEE